MVTLPEQRSLHGRAMKNAPPPVKAISFRVRHFFHSIRHSNERFYGRKSHS
jgi:hypothetical protein